MWMQEGEMEDGDENYMEITSRYEKWAVQLAWLGLEDLVSVILPAKSGFVPAILGWHVHSHTKLSYLPVPYDDFHHLFSTLSFLSATQPSLKNLKVCHHSLSLHAMIMS
jgi:hypothetical protein